MIRDLSLTLQAMLTQRGLPAELAAARIAFDRPGENFRPGQTMIDLFLYDIRENLELRNPEPVLERLNGHAVRHRPPLRVDCTYLVTAWPVGGEDIALQEHHLLAQVLQVFACHRTIPARFLQGDLRDQQPPLPLFTSRSDGLKEPAQFWSAIGGRLRPSLSVTATIGLEIFAAETVRLVTSKKIRSRTGHSPGRAPRLRIGGRVLTADGTAVAGATVLLVEADLSATAGADGRYAIGPVAPGRHTLRAQSGALNGTITITVPQPPVTPPADRPVTPPADYDVQLTSA
jgi:hypothetical protein